MYQPRTYRNWVDSDDLVWFNIVVEETDLSIGASTNLEERARQSVARHRASLEVYIRKHPAFETSLVPVELEPAAPEIAREMARAAARMGVGPMAAVAGAIAEFVGRDLLPFTDDLIIENGGDIFLKSSSKRTIAIYAGDSPLSGRIGLEIARGDAPLGICTSSGTVGHSLSFGKADAVVIVSPSACLADAAATAIANTIDGTEDVQKAIKMAEDTDGLIGAVIIKDDIMGVFGDFPIRRIRQA